jgi:succinyl-CoA synthetase beta subunit
MEHGLRALGKFLWWSELLYQPPDRIPEGLPLSFSHNLPLKGHWSEAQARMLLEEGGIPVVPGQLATAPDEAVQVAQELGLPVALKIQSAALLHKSDVGGVALALSTEQAIRAEFSAMLERVRRTHPQAEIEGILVCPMRPAGIELLVGIVHDPLWGPVLTLGLGGIWTEVFKDTSVRVLPVSSNEIEKMLGELRGSALLHGTRGQQSIDIQKLCGIIFRICSFALALGPSLGVLEINPLLVHPSHIEVLDVLVSWQS